MSPKSFDPAECRTTQANNDVPEIIRSEAINGGRRSKPALDTRLPPIFELSDIFDDISEHAIQLGLKAYLHHMGSRKLRVVTMCSGTESPLLALEMVSDGLKRNRNLTFSFEHLFSAEIVPFKQAYIERNFHPPYVFRDVRELSSKEATTAYGAKREVPGNPDILVAGFSCVDFSALNQLQKSLDQKGESGQTFYGILGYASHHRPPLVVLENVKNAPWADVARRWENIGYASVHVIVDTKAYYLPQTRERGYMICVDKERISDIAAIERITESWSEVFQRFKRQASSPVNKFILDDDDIRLEQIQKDMASRTAGTARAVINWSRYQSRHQSYRLNTDLGYKRPLTRYQDNGACKMPDFAWQEWSRVQPERIWDTLDMNYLRSLPTFDLNYKQRILDLSQGIDREVDSRPFGVVGCITPSGMQYVTTRGGPLCGLESLSLQGLPLHRLLLTRESQRDLQDLAGNAMSSTVVGPAILAALIVGYGALDSGSSYTPLTQSMDDMYGLEPKDDRQLAQRHLDSSNITNMPVANLLEEGAKSARLCVCEGQSTLKRRGVLKCAICGHTACSTCGGNPTHKYDVIHNDWLNERGSPLKFVDDLKDLLPMRLALSALRQDTYNCFRKDTAVPCSDRIWTTFLEIVRQAFGDELRFLGIKRTQFWTVIYEGTFSSLNLVIGAQDIEWLFYAKPPASEPAHSIIREVLSRPVARMRPKKKAIACSALLNGQWEICAPISSTTILEIAGIGMKVESHESRCGLQGPAFFGKMVWSHISITGSDKAVKDLDIDVRGEYELLQNCGSANASLHKRASTSESPSLYIFLEPQKLGPPDLDSYVISLTHERLTGDKPRQIILELTHKWRAANLDNKPSPVKTFYRKWVPCLDVSLETFESSTSITCHTIDPQADLQLQTYSCSEANITLLKFSAPASAVKLPWQIGPWKTFNLVESTTILHDYSWLLQKVAHFIGFENWTTIACDYSGSGAICPTCAPQKPRMIWTLDSRGHMRPVEDPLDASIYERQIKARPVPFLGFTRIDDRNVGQLHISLNIKTLLHQAYDKLMGPTMDSNVKFCWRLLSKSPDLRDFDFGKLMLENNRGDTERIQPPNFERYSLRPEQLRSLSWMLACERENLPPFEEEEVEEALLSPLMWRAEAKVSISRVVRGGILADEVGYGKTALILGLIDAQHSHDEARYLDAVPDGVIPLKATLIIAPSIIITQWQSEITKFLGDIYKVVAISSFVALRKQTIESFRNADIILVSSSLLTGDAYYRAVEQFAGSPAPPDTKNGGRIFSHWLSDALTSTAEHVNILRTQGTEPLLAAINAKYDAVKVERKYFLYQPSKRVKGKNLARENEINQLATTIGRDQGSIQSWVERETGIKRVAGKKRKLKAAEEEQLDDKQDPRVRKPGYQKWDSARNVFFHMFRYSRLVIDEFTYIDLKKAPTVWTLQSRTKWILSGTPPLNDFAGVKSIATFLGIRLGSDEFDESQNRRGDRTDAEDFQSFKVVKSAAWHRHRHSAAQIFLNRFMRQNIAEIDEIPWTEHFYPVKLSPAERAVYFELYMQLMAHKLQLRKNIKASFNNDQVTRINEIIGTSGSAEEALIKRCAYFDWRGNAKGRHSVDSYRGLIEIRTRQICDLKKSFKSKLKLATWLFNECGLEHTHFHKFLQSVSKHDFGDVEVTGEAQPLIENARRAYKEDDWKRFFTAKKTRKLTENNSGDTRGGGNMNDSQDAIEKKPSRGKKAKPPLPKRRVLRAAQNPHRRTTGEDQDVESEPDASDDSEYVPEPSPKRKRVSKKAKESSVIPLTANNENAAEPTASGGYENHEDVIKPDLPVEPKDVVSRLRHLTTVLRSEIAEWVCRHRALRFLETVRGFQANETHHSCSLCGYESGAPAVFNVLGQCGHAICRGCIEVVRGNEECAVKGCRGSGKEFHIIKVSDLGLDRDESVSSYGGRKLAELVNLLNDPFRIPVDDRIIIFVQFEDVMHSVCDALDMAEIKYASIGLKDRSASSKISEFQDTKTRNVKVLLLLLGGENAAGLNLQCANHVIFFSPLLANTQYDYDSSMMQAIGRARRYGQTKHVHIYHFLALYTIDVNILQERTQNVLVERDEAFALVDVEDILEKDIKGWEGSSLEGENAV